MKNHYSHGGGKNYMKSESSSSNPGGDGKTHGKNTMSTGKSTNAMLTNDPTGDHVAIPFKSAK